MANRLNWQTTPAKSLVSAETGMYLMYMRISSTAQRRERVGGGKAAGNPPAYSLRVNPTAQ
jgi:hypothetical protein